MIEIMFSKKIIPNFDTASNSIRTKLAIPLLKNLKILGNFIAEFKTLSGILLRKLCHQ